jgi:hypothetical protein
MRLAVITMGAAESRRLAASAMRPSHRTAASRIVPRRPEGLNRVRSQFALSARLTLLPLYAIGGMGAGDVKPQIGRTEGGRAVWGLRVHGTDVPGRWVIVGREFGAVDGGGDPGPYAGGPLRHRKRARPCDQAAVSGRAGLSAVLGPSSTSARLQTPAAEAVRSFNGVLGERDKALWCLSKASRRGLLQEHSPEVLAEWVLTGKIGIVSTIRQRSPDTE